MHVLVDIGHPAHVHFFRHAIAALHERGHTTAIATRNIPIARRLLEAYNLPYHVASQKRRGRFGLARELFEHNAHMLGHIRRKRPDVCVAIGGTFMVHATWLCRVRRLVFYDTETALTANRITYPFATSVITPAYYPLPIRGDHKTYPGLHELAYLHPNYFSAEEQVLSRYGLSAKAPYFIVRLIAWEASHDLAVKPATGVAAEKLTGSLNPREIALLGKYIPGKIFVFSKAIYFFSNIGIPPLVAGQICAVNMSLSLLIGLALSTPLLLGPAATLHLYPALLGMLALIAAAFAAPRVIFYALARYSKIQQAPRAASFPPGSRAVARRVRRL